MASTLAADSRREVTQAALTLRAGAEVAPQSDGSRGRGTTA